MSVLVDVGYNYSKVGTGIINNGSASPQVVSLVAPGFNSYYATIYWDTVNATAGVSYGVPLITPAPYLPDDITLVPLAFVLIGNGTTSITASNVTDIRFAVVERHR
jgi:hypothetical protein